MENNALIFTNTALVIGCAVMAIVFLALPLPPKKGLNKYRISLRVLAGAYIILAILNSLLMALDTATVNLLSMSVLTISSLQATLFASSLIILLNPLYITRRYLFIQLMPVLLLTGIYILVADKHGDPDIEDFSQLKLLATHPTLLIREILLFFYLFQLIFLTLSFHQQVRKYEAQIDNYFADSYQLRLKWVKYCFYIALSIGIYAILSCFFISVIMVFTFIVVCTLFYIFFGIYYIQYPNTFIYIEPAIYPQQDINEVFAKTYKRIDWNEMKRQIFNDNYYLRTDVNIEEMALYLKIGRTTLSNLINKEEEMNFHSWINTMRIEEAQRLLISNPDYSISQVADMIGFSEPTNFSRQFKQITSHSPSAWKQKHLNKSELG